MKKLACVLYSLHTCLFGLSQTDRWQQEVNFKIDVRLDDATNTLHAFEQLEYINNSPDTLNYIWFHIWPNAYKDETSAFYKQLSLLKERKDKLKKFKETGYIDSLSFKADGKIIRYENHPEYNDVIKLVLNKPLYPHEHITLTTPFVVKLPSYISRLGHDKQTYMITQWYPKPAVYDKQGWHAMPYLDMGEFYSEYGTFDVSITVPSAYVVAATGLLQTTSEKNLYQSIGRKNKELIDFWMQNQNPQKIKSLLNFYKPEKGGQKTLSWHAENVHDFAWFADAEFVINYDTLKLPSNRVIDVYSFYHASDRVWYNSGNYVEDVVRAYSAWIGEYAYPAVNVVEGPVNASSGGMEYPMITLITSPGADDKKLDGLIAHEVGHNWFYAMLGTNERDHPWMDEGINSYYQFKYEGEKYHSNLVFGNAIPQSVKDLDNAGFFAAIYNAMNQIPMDEPVQTSSVSFKDDEEYSEIVYLKAAIWMYTMELSLGSDKLHQGMQAYFTDWRFKHPYPNDMKSSFEKGTDMELSELFDLLHQKGNFK